MSSGVEILAQANQLRQERRYRESLVIYAALLQAEPENREALIGKGWALLLEGEKINDAGYDEALICFQSALKGNEGNVAMLHEYVRALIETGAIRHWKTASQVCDQILALVPNDLQALIGKARVLCWLGQNEESIVICDRIIEINVEMGEGWNCRGWALYALDRYEDAIACFDRALALDSRLTATWAFRGLILMKLGRQQEALASVDRALELAPNYSTAKCFKIDILQAMGKPDEAQRAIDELPPIEFHF